MVAMTPPVVAMIVTPAVRPIIAVAPIAMGKARITILRCRATNQYGVGAGHRAIATRAPDDAAVLDRRLLTARLGATLPLLAILLHPLVARCLTILFADATPAEFPTALTIPALDLNLAALTLDLDVASAALDLHLALGLDGLLDLNLALDLDLLASLFTRCPFGPLRALSTFGPRRPIVGLLRLPVLTPLAPAFFLRRSHRRNGAGGEQNKHGQLTHLTLQAIDLLRWNLRLAR